MITIGQTIESPVLTGLGVLLLVLWAAAALTGIVGLIRALAGGAKNAGRIGLAAIAMGAFPAAVYLLFLVVSGDPLSALATLFLNLWGWLVVSPVLIGVAAWCIDKRNTAVPGRCAKCNYDLRGSQHSTTCPECGEPIPNPA